MKNENDVKLTASNVTHTITTTSMTTGATDVIAGYKAYTNNNTPTHTATLLDTDSLRDIVDRISALERIRPSQIYKVENCPNCGGSMKLYAEDHILKCRYCKSVVFVGIKNING